MPRFTNEPGAMSRATSRARSSRPKGVVDVWMLMSGHLHDAVDVDSRGHHVLRVQGAGRDDLRHLDDGVFGRGGHDGAEVPGGLAVDEVALAVGLEGLDECDVGVDGRLEHLPFAVEEARVLAFREHGAVTGGGEEPANTRARGPDTLGEVPLRD